MNPSLQIDSATQRNRASVSVSNPVDPRTATPEIAVLVSSFEKPDHLKRVLISVAMQDLPRGAMEVVVTDDGSRDGTEKMVATLARDMPFPVKFATHPHDGFQLSRCRNEGVAASKAPYILFLDGDCVIEPDHVRKHLTHRHEGWVMGGYCCRLDESTSESIDETAIRAVAYPHLVPKKELKRLASRDRKARFYSFLRHQGKPKLAGGNIGIFRSDYERVNGYNERFVGWGGEDDDLRSRLARVGLRIGSILRWTRTYHLWHPPADTAVKKYWDGANVGRLHRPGKLTRCRQGLVARSLFDIDFQIAGATSDANERVALETRIRCNAPFLLSAWKQWLSRSSSAPSPEVEILFWPAQGESMESFSGKADCNILIMPPNCENEALSSRRWKKIVRKADWICSQTCPSGFQTGETHFATGDWDQLFESIS